MTERKIDCQSDIPEIAFATPDHTFANPDKLLYSTFRSTDGKNSFAHIPQFLPATGEKIMVPVVGLKDFKNVSDVVVVSNRNYRTERTVYGHLPTGGFREDAWFDKEAKRHHFHLDIPAYIDEYTSEIIQKRIEQTPPDQRKEKFASIVKMLPRVRFFSDKGLAFYIRNEMAVSLTPAPMVYINGLTKEEDGKVLYNFIEGELNQKLNPYEDEFFYEYSIWQDDDPLILSDGGEAALYYIARISFGKNVDFNYINTYLKTYSDHKDLNERVIRSLVNPSFTIYLNRLL